MYALSFYPSIIFVGEALRTAAFILNHVHSIHVSRTPYKLMLGKRPILQHFHVWGCKAKVRPYNPEIKNLDPKTISGFFIEALDFIVPHILLESLNLIVLCILKGN